MSVTVVGAGYAGIMAANRLAGRGVPVTLVTPHPWFLERIRLHTVATGHRASARRELTTLLHPAIEVVHDEVLKITATVLELKSGSQQRYETLVYAVGSGAPSPGTLHRITSEEGAEELRADLRRCPLAPVTVIGAGLTGIELAGALRAAGRHVRLVTGSVPDRRASHANLEHLRRQGVVIERNHYDLRQKDEEAITVDATGLNVPTLAADSGLPTDAQGRLLVDATLTVPGHPHVLGAGDAVYVDAPGVTHLRPACATALPMGAHSADVIHARRHGQVAPAFSMGYALQCVDLGSGQGRVQFVNADDSERPFAATARAGGLLKELVCRMTVHWLSREAKYAGRYSWPSRSYAVNLGRR